MEWTYIILLLFTILTTGIIVCVMYWVDRKYPRKDKEADPIMKSALITLLFVLLMAFYDFYSGTDYVKKYFWVFFLVFGLVYGAYWITLKVLGLINYRKLKSKALEFLDEEYGAKIRPSGETNYLSLIKYKIVKEGMPHDVRNEVAHFFWELIHGSDISTIFWISLNARTGVPLDIVPNPSDVIMKALEVRDVAIGKDVRAEAFNLGGGQEGGEQE